MGDRLATGSEMSATATEMIATALNAGQLAEAERLSRAGLDEQPDDGNLQLLLAVSLHLQEKLDAAIPLYAELTRLYPQSGVHWSNYATALRDSGDLAAAAEAYAASLQCEPKNAQTLLNLGLLQMQQQAYPDARQTLIDAHLLDPESIPIRIRAASACSACRDMQIDKLLQPWRTWTGLDDELQLELAHLLMAQGDAKGAEGLLREILQRSPAYVPAQLQLAVIYERMNRLDATDRMLRQIITEQLVLDEPVRKEIVHQQARLAQRRGDWTGSRAMLERAGPNDASDYVHYFALAESCDKLGDTAAAMQALATAHARQIEEMRRVAPSHFLPGAPVLPAAATRLGREEFLAWPKLRAPESSQSPVFIVGFPRSGTTLLEQMLDAHPRLQSMDERPFFHMLARQLENSTGFQVPRDLGKLSQRDCDELRMGYLTFACSKVPRRWNAQLVDKAVNIIESMGARVIGSELAKTIADAFLHYTGGFDPDGPSGGNVKAIESVDTGILQVDQTNIDEYLEKLKKGEPIG